MGGFDLYRSQYIPGFDEQIDLVAVIVPPEVRSNLQGLGSPDDTSAIVANPSIHSGIFLQTLKVCPLKMQAVHFVIPTPPTEGEILEFCVHLVIRLPTACHLFGYLVAVFYPRLSPAKRQSSLPIGIGPGFWQTRGLLIPSMILAQNKSFHL